ncbi:Protein of unknown function [Andreprevotia lacus DSM 23236]|jgi:hypothetical protein|uniref:Thymidine phosphorylase n=1 Tax=Andreprevotia lacus DSM 23236 TaxID=1121001 RepID=A0A1W1X231_9NEIS|nr:DUF1631 family protein [Andreprevotia lacus]SMC18029.1 Protein of unknown function [Andreprevotia lacus DSM 23236]
MDRNDLLAATRSEFLRAFAASISDLAERASASLFESADRARSMAEQRDLLDARIVLGQHAGQLHAQLLDGMERLLNRSFQTAYSTFRPSFSDSFSASSLSLLDTSAVEGELRLDAVTNRLRGQAEEALRDLNIRVALLFEQDNIKERENPFRPYLLSRCIASSAESMSTVPEIVVLLTDHLCDGLLDRVAVLYERLNVLLARHGIAAELQLKIRRQVAGPGAVPQPAGAEADRAPDAAAAAPPAAQPFDAAAMAATMSQLSELSELLSAQSRLDNLFQLVQHPDRAAPPPIVIDSAAVEQLAHTLRDGQTVPPATQSTGWLAGAQSVGNVLRGLFSGLRPGGLRPLEPVAAGVQTPLLEMVQSLQHSPFRPDEQDGAEGTLQNLIIEQRQTLNQAVGDSNEQMIIDIVGMLFEFILRDNQVPAEVRAQLGRLQFAVLRIALLDPALFSQKNHPARMLVNRIGSISAGLHRVDPGGERVANEIRRIIEALLADPHDDVSLFSTMLDQLDAFIAHELRTADARVQRAAQAVENTESRTLQYARITAMIAEGLTGLTLDGYLRDFLIQTWAQVIEHAGRTDEARAQSYQLLIPDLIWSIVPKPGPHERKQLFAMIPALLPALQQGLSLIGWSEAQRQQFVHWLVEAHKDALRVVDLPGVPPPLSMLHERFAPVFAKAREAEQAVSASEPPQMDERLFDEAIRELEVDLQVFDRMLGDSDSANDASVEQEGMVDTGALGDATVAVVPQQDPLAILRSGVPIEVNLDGNPTEGTLSWVNQSESTLILSMGDDRPPLVIGAKLIRRLLSSGRARFIEVPAVFERAVESLLESADRVA